MTTLFDSDIKIVATLTCINTIKEFEDFRSEPYLCVAGYPTIGYGSRWYLNSRAVSMKDKPIDEPSAYFLLAVTVDRCWRAVDSLIKPKLNENQLAALTSLTFNIGLDAFRTSTVLRLVNSFPENPKIRDAFAMWNKHRNVKTGQLEVSRGLVNRRRLEADLYFTPVKTNSSV